MPVRIDDDQAFPPSQLFVICAEHGLGVMKPDAIHYSQTPVAVALMRQIKSSFDPHGILNPYKVLPAE